MFIHSVTFESTPGPWLLLISVVQFQTCAHFREIAQTYSLCDFDYISEGIPSLMRFWLLMTKVLPIWFMHIFGRPKKSQESRTRCISLLDYQKSGTFSTDQEPNASPEQYKDNIWTLFSVTLEQAYCIKNCIFQGMQQDDNMVKSPTVPFQSTWGGG